MQHTPQYKWINVRNHFKTYLGGGGGGGGGAVIKTTIKRIIIIRFFTLLAKP